MKIHSDSVKRTIDIGKAIAKRLRPSDIICLYGQLGSGKTVLAKGIASGLGLKKSAVISPTFVLIRQYDAKIPMYHFDLYRLAEAKDMLYLGYEDYLCEDGVSVIEWPERLGFLMPQEYLKIEISIKGKNKRLLRFTAKGSRYKDILKGMNENIRN